MPAKFPNCPKYLSKTKKRRRSPKQRQNFSLRKIPKVERNLVCEQSLENLDIARIVKSENENIIVSPDLQDEIESHESEVKSLNNDEIENPESEVSGRCDKENNLFRLMFSNKNCVSYPLPWTRQNLILNEGNKIQFVHWTTKFINDKHKPVCFKQLVINSDLTVDFFVSGLSVDLDKCGQKMNVSTAMEVETLLNNVQALKTCSGISSPSADINFETSFARRDDQGFLRHKNCCLIMGADSKGLRCDTCKTGRNTLKKKRKEIERTQISATLKTESKSFKQKKVKFDPGTTKT